MTRLETWTNNWCCSFILTVYYTIWHYDNTDCIISNNHMLLKWFTSLALYKSRYHHINVRCHDFICIYMIDMSVIQLYRIQIILLRQTTWPLIMQLIYFFNRWKSSWWTISHSIGHTSGNSTWITSWPLARHTSWHANWKTFRCPSWLLVMYVSEYLCDIIDTLHLTRKTLAISYLLLVISSVAVVGAAVFRGVLTSAIDSKRIIIVWGNGKKHALKAHYILGSLIRISGYLWARRGHQDIFLLSHNFHCLSMDYQNWYTHN